MKKILLLLTIGVLFASCDVEGFTTKEVIQDFSTLSDDEIIAKYGEPKNSKWNVKSFTITKVRFEDMNNTSFENINLSGAKLDKETGFEGKVQRGGSGIYVIKMEGKSEAIYNTNKKHLRVSIQQN